MQCLANRSVGEYEPRQVLYVDLLELVAQQAASRKLTKGGGGRLVYSVSCGIDTHVSTQWFDAVAFVALTGALETQYAVHSEAPRSLTSVFENIMADTIGDWVATETRRQKPTLNDL